MPEIQMMPVGQVKPYEKNPRVNDAAVEKVAASIREFGFKVPIIVDKANVIITGHTRLKAALSLGMNEVPVIVAADLSPAKVKAFRLADNKVAEAAAWDYEMLRSELDDLASLGDFDMPAFGFDGPLVEFESFDGAGDGGGSQIARGTKLRVVLGHLMFDIDDPSHEIYDRTTKADPEIVKARIAMLLEGDDLI
jgi:hypothetical protein